MISCEFHGRLGNNMFQIAAAASVAKKLGVDFSVPTYTLAGHRGALPSDLQGFDYPYHYHQDYNVNEHEKIGEKDNQYTELPLKDNIKLCGFFQSYKYFDDIREDLINSYFAPAGWILEFSKKYNVSDRSVGVCVRRGDYLMLQDNHCVLNEDYYQETCNNLIAHSLVDNVFVFSDDMDWCKNVFSNIGATFVEADKFVQLYLMTQMKHLILANSTFSWWGAYLNNKGGNIYVPDPWYGPNNQHLDTSGLFYPKWIVQKHYSVFQQYLREEAMKG